MDRRIQQAIDEDFERMVRESPRPRLINGNLSGDFDIFKEQCQQQILRPVPTGLVRNRAAAFASPHPITLVSPTPQYNNSINGHDVSNVNESIEEIFDYIKRKSFESSGEDIENNSKDDQNENFSQVKEVSVETDDISDGYTDHVETIENSFSVCVDSPNELNNHDEYRQGKEKDTSNTVHNHYDEVDMGDTGYVTSNLRDEDLSVSVDEHVITAGTIGNDYSKDELVQKFQNNTGTLHSDNRSAENDTNKDDGITCTGELQVSVQDDENMSMKGIELMCEIECTEVGEDEDHSTNENSESQQGAVQERSPCSLYMWIIKPIPGTQLICVEGKKHPEEDEFWKSGVVTKRLDQTTVLTQSGSVYRLIGDIEFADAVYAGFSRETVAAFKTGFPENWTAIVDDHFNNSGLNRPDTSQTKIVSSTVTDPAPLNVQESSSQDKVQEYVLSKWLPKPVGKGICVEGFNPDGILWHSSAIETRVSSKKLVTSNGSICRLKGNIDKLQAKEKNIPDAIITKFQTGFPKEWLELIQEHFTTEWFDGKEKKNQNGKEDKKPERSRKEIPKVEGKKKPIRSLAAKQVLSMNKRRSHLKSKDSVRNPSFKSDVSVDSVGLDTSVVSADMLDQTVLTPAGKVVDLSQLKRSRSGRILKPPLHSYTGQGYAFTEDGCLTVTGTTDYAKKFLKEIEDSYKNKSNRFARYTYYPLNDSKLSVSSKSSILSESKNTNNLVKKKNHNNVLKSRKRSVNKQQTKSAEKKLGKKLVVTKSEESKGKPNSAHTAAKRLKLKQAPTDDSDPKLDEEVFVLLNEVKKKFLRSQRPGRTTCYNGSFEKDSSRSGKQLNASADAYVLDESPQSLKNLARANEPSNAATDSNESLNVTKESSNSDRTGKKVVRVSREQRKSSEAPEKSNKPLKVTKQSNTSLSAGEGSNESLNSTAESSLSLNVTKESSTYANVDKDPSESGKTVKDSSRSLHATKESSESLIAAKRSRESSTVTEKSEVSSEAAETVLLAADVKKSGKGLKSKEKNKRKTVKGKQNKHHAHDTETEHNKSETDNENKADERTSDADTDTSQREVVSSDPVKGETGEDKLSLIPVRVLRSNTRSAKVDGNNNLHSDRRKRAKLSKIAEANDIVTKRKIRSKKVTTDKTKQMSQVRSKKSNETKSVETAEEETDSSKASQEDKMESRENQERDKNKDQENDEKKHEKKDRNQKKTTAEKPKEVALTAKSGTLKRRLQLKAVLEQHNENYEDNLFDSTPFRKTRKRKRAVLEDDDDALFEELAKKQGKSRFETPAGVVMNGRTSRTLKLASARKTPACFNKEDLLGSAVKNLDGYVHNIRKRQMLHAKRKIKNQTPKLLKKTVCIDDSPQKKLFNEFLQAKIDDTEDHKDSDNEEDYYWDEETT